MTKDFSSIGRSVEHQPATQSGLKVNAYFISVYNWMLLGLLTTAGVAYATAAMVDFNAPYAMVVFFGCLIAELGLVFYLNSAISKLSGSTATALFMLYSALNGVTLSVVLLAYPSEIITKAFLITAAMFGAMSLYGLVTKRDLTKMGSFMMMGVFGLIIAMLINFFFRSPALDYAISCIGVVVFLGLTAYHTQRIYEFGKNAPLDNPEAIRRGAILGALTLYLSFINLFLMVLRFLNNRQ